MRVVFHTNIAGWRFPEKVCCRPLIGDSVRPMNDNQILKVCAVTHCESPDGPYLYVELTGTPRH